MENYTLSKVFDSNHMPEQIKNRFMTTYAYHVENNEFEHYIKFCVGYDDNQDISNWLIAQGAKSYECVLILV